MVDAYLSKVVLECLLIDKVWVHVDYLAATTVHVEEFLVCKGLLVWTETYLVLDSDFASDLVFDYLCR